MSIEREGYNGPITFLCDGNRCHEIDETHCTDFDSAFAKAKAHGWRARNVNGEWQHLCRDCVQENK